MPDLLLKVNYFSQRDSTTGHSMRMCFSSACAMLLDTLKPGAIKGANEDDQYLRTVFRYGDTTIAAAQVQALKHYGISAEFRQNLSWADLDAKLAKGIPVPIGILHHGHVSKPTGGGHWILIIGKKADGSAYYVHDPFGDLDLINGGYIATVGRQLAYSVKNLGPRWRVGGAGGWGIIAKRP
jgi:hypothetical protein